MVMVAWRCDLCGHVWLARGPEPPELCARCRRRRWNTCQWDGKVELGDQQGLKIANVEGGELKIVMVEGVGMAVVKVGPRAKAHGHATTGGDLLQQESMAGLFAEGSGKGARHTAKQEGPSPLAAGDYRAMADLWLQFLRPLPHSRRLGMLVEFFKLLPQSYRSDVMWAATSPRILKPRPK